MSKPDFRLVKFTNANEGINYFEQKMKDLIASLRERNEEIAQIERTVSVQRAAFLVLAVAFLGVAIIAVGFLLEVW